MNILMLLVGCFLGWGLKFAMDYYHEFKTTEEKRASQMEDILTRFKAQEIIKDL